MADSVLFVALTFLFGGFINRFFASPKCNAGVEKLDIQQELNCGCISDLGPPLSGVATCNSGGVVSVLGDIEGDSSFDQMYGIRGSFDSNEDLVAFLSTTSDTPGGPYEVQVVATPDSSSTFGTCTAGIFTNSGLEECTSCSICSGNLSFQANCANLLDGDGPVFDQCLNFSFQLVAK